MRKENVYQICLITLGIVSTLMFGAFFYHELFPEYKIYQNRYAKLEEFRSTYTGKPVPEFEYGVKQIVIPDPDKGPATIDRCISCHVALKFPHFAEKKIKKDVNGNVVFDADGIPVLVPNPDDVWSKLTPELDYLKTVQVGDYEYDVTKVLRAHPLIGKETRPFEFHSIEEFGCTSCHGGNGRGLVTDRAHGPVIDGKYEKEEMGPEPKFLETDPNGNDPQFSMMFNHKPGHRLLFQTEPILTGNLIQARCVQCHMPSEASFEELSIIPFSQEVKAVRSLLRMRGKNIAELEKFLDSPGLTFDERKYVQENIKFLSQGGDVDAELVKMVGSLDIANQLTSSMTDEGIFNILASKGESGTLFAKVQKIEDISSPLKKQVPNDLKRMTRSYKRGEELFISQGCYGCHRIASFSRGGVGPELTEGGMDYPWALKEAMVWPQGDLKTSTMPNYELDHEELEDLMTFLLAQRSDQKRSSETQVRVEKRAWEAGRKLPWEKPIPAKKVQDLKYAMTVFAEEGCAACHRLKGYNSQITVTDSAWFKKRFPEEITGSQIVAAIEKYHEEIDTNLVDTGTEGLIEEIGDIWPFYSNFQYAKRAKDHSPKEKELWRARVDKLVRVYAAEYGFGRLIGPRPNWSGVYRSDQWLMEHFWSPGGHVARSIMPVMPFDNSKFLALTHMLNVLGNKNRDELRKVWQTEGFSPFEAYNTLCAQCHGPNLEGNGPVSQWIYPIPKNLRNAQYLRNLTREKATESIVHGVKGGPMAPWGEGDNPVLTEKEAGELVDWIYQDLPGKETINTVPKWEYKPEDAIENLEAIEPNYQAAIKPMPGRSYTVLDIFDEVPPKNYYIKKRFYTPKNLAEGESLFQLHCSVCHGADASGTGARAGTMEFAKPRMLTNLDWIESRDDMRLLSSIKFGVSGTSMNAWGDQTTPLQRMQMVMYVRSLTETRKDVTAYKNLLYQAFDESIWALQRAPDTTQAVQAQQQLKKYFEKLGDTFFNMYGSEPVFKTFEELVKVSGGAYINDGTLLKQPLDVAELDRLTGTIVGTLNKYQESYRARLALAEGKLNKQVSQEEQTKIEQMINAVTELRRDLLSTVAEIKRDRT